MKKSAKIALLLMAGILVFLLCFVKLNYKNDSKEAMLIKSFSNSGAEVLSTEIYFTGTVQKSKKSFEEQKLFVEDLGEKLGVLKNEAFLSRQIKNDSIQKIEVSGTTKNNRAIDINLQLNEGVKSNENIITVSITQYKSFVGLEEIKKNVLAILKSNKIHPKVNSCITGNIAGKWDDTKLNEISDKMLNSVEAEKISSMKDRNLISVSAYSHYLGSTLNISGKKMNLNLAIRYNSLEDKTYIWLATPVITIEY
jgi:hypothetical protein